MNLDLLTPALCACQGSLCVALFPHPKKQDTANEPVKVRQLVNGQWRTLHQSPVGPQTFNFPAGYTLAPGATVRVESYTGTVNNPPSILLWSTGAIWANTGGKAVLYDSSGKTVDSACYGNACP